MRRIKVLMCGNHPSNKGGMTTVISQINEHDWSKDNVEFRFIATYFPGPILLMILYFGISFCRVLGTMLIWKPDVLHLHLSYRGSFIRNSILQKVGEALGCRVVIHLHGSEFENWYNASNDKKKEKIKRLIRSADIFIVLGNKWETFIKRTEPSANVVVLKNTVPLNDKIVYLTCPIKLLYLGVLEERKGVKDLLHAVASVDEGISLDIVGDGKKLDNLINICQENNILKRVTFHGWLTGNEKEKVMLENNVLVLPSYAEGLPMSILEAMSMGMPIIATSVGDISSAVIDGENGFLIEPGDKAHLIRCINKLNDIKTLDYMSKKSKEILKCDFSEEKFFNLLLSFYVGMTNE